ncbi:DNA-binding protein inhibitor ID-2-like protein, partial [Leptotrombidium deliense]
MQQLLTKLQELVPNMPKNKKLSKLEIIQNVIDYIFDLESALESHPA